MNIVTLCKYFFIYWKNRHVLIHVRVRLAGWPWHMTVYFNSLIIVIIIFYKASCCFQRDCFRCRIRFLVEQCERASSSMEKHQWVIDRCDQISSVLFVNYDTECDRSSWDRHCDRVRQIDQRYIRLVVDLYCCLLDSSHFSHYSFYANINLVVYSTHVKHTSTSFKSTFNMTRLLSWPQ